MARLTREPARVTEALEFVRRHGIVLASAKGNAPRLIEAILGESISGNWRETRAVDIGVRSAHIANVRSLCARRGRHAAYGSAHSGRPTTNRRSRAHFDNPHVDLTFFGVSDDGLAKK